MRDVREARFAMACGGLTLLALVLVIAAAQPVEPPPQMAAAAIATEFLAPLLALSYNGWVAVVERRPWRWLCAPAAFLATVPAIAFLSKMPPPSHGSCPQIGVFPSGVRDTMEPFGVAIAVLAVPAAIVLVVVALKRPQTRPVAFWCAGLLIAAFVNLWITLYSFLCAPK